MARTSFAPQDLGRLPVIESDEFDRGAILWDRFCVVGVSRAARGVQIVPVTDLERALGEAPTHRVELHLLDASAGPQQRARIRQALILEALTQPRVYATMETGDKLAMICPPPRGQAIDSVPVAIAEGKAGSAQLDDRKLSVVANELSALLTKLHAIDLHGVRFQREQFRFDNGQFFLGDFTHIIGQPRTPQADIEDLVSLLSELGADNLAQPMPTSAQELWRRARALADDSLLNDITLPAEPAFVGREGVLRTLKEALSEAEIAQPTALIIHGRRGVGKSRLLREFVTTRLDADDAFVLTGTWQPRSSDTRGGLLGAVDQLTRMMRNLNPEERESVRHRLNRATRNLGAIVARSAPSLGSILRGVEELPPLELSGDFSRHTSVIADLLRSIGTQKRPLVLVLDNLEMADSRSIEVLKILAQPRPAHHTLILAGFRDDAPRSKKPELTATSVGLDPLRPDEIERLLARTLAGQVEDSPTLAESLWTVSKGNPLSLWANLRSWIDRGLLVHDPTDAIWRAPHGLVELAEEEPDVRDLFGFRLVGTEPPVLRLALRMAVLSTELSTAEVRELASLDDLSVEDAIDALATRGLLTRTPHGVRFPHDSIREFVLESVGTDERRAAHQDIAALLLRQDAPVAQITYHRDLGFDPDTASQEEFDRLSSMHVDAGRDRLAVYDLERARWHLERALEHSRDTDQRSLAAEALADVCLLRADFDGAIALYTALVAASDDLRAIRAAGKACYFLWFQNLPDEAQQLGHMALEVIGEPMPRTPLGKLFSTLRSVIMARFRPPPYSAELRDALCVLYPVLVLNSLATDPLATMNYLARGYWLTKNLHTGSAALTLSMVASVRASFGHFEAANEMYAESMKVATEADDPWARGICAHTWAHQSMLPSNRYDEGQDMLDDAIAAFRETGDMSVAIVSLTMKALYGRDREPGDTVLGWLDEGVSMARRNAKSAMLTSIEAIRLVILARQGRSDAAVRARELAVSLESANLTAVDRIFARSQLALAALEAGERELAHNQAAAGLNEMAEVPGAPEFCLEIHYAMATVLVHRQLSRQDRKLMRQATTKLKRTAKLSPRIAVLRTLFELKLAVSEQDNARMRNLASDLVGGFENHGNTVAAFEAHRALAQLQRAENVLAAAEHERIARHLGRRLGLNDMPLSLELSESFEDAANLLALSPAPNFSLDPPKQHIPAAGMLDASVTQPIKAEASSEIVLGSEHDDVLEAWALSSSSKPVASTLKEVLGPLSNTIRASLSDATLDIECSEPDLELPIAASDLQILIINMVLSGRDAVGGDSQISTSLEVEQIDDDGRRRPLGDEPLRSGRYLTVRVTARGKAGTQSPVIGGFGTCESLLKQFGGKLTASADRNRTVLLGHIPLDPVSAQTPISSFGKVLIVHPDLATRETLILALAELGVDAVEIKPDSFEAARLAEASLLLADAASLRKLRVLEPLFSARLVEIVQRGSKPQSPNQQEKLRVPFALSELESLLKA